MAVRNTRESIQVGTLADTALRMTRASIQVANVGDPFLRLTRISLQVAVARPESDQGKGRRTPMAFNRSAGP